MYKQDYFSREYGSTKKKWKGSVPVALLFPNLYRIGMSNLGFQLVYAMINRHPEIVCERFFLPDIDGDMPKSIESGRLLADFPFIFCSVSFENDFPGIVRIFQLAGLVPLAEDRSKASFLEPGNPLIIGGGVATFINPEPLALFFDLFILGEAEPVLPGILEVLVNGTSAKDRESLLWELSLEHQGCYVPGFYNVAYGADLTIESVKPLKSLPARIKTVVHTGADQVGCSTILTPDAEFSDLFLSELGRGCSRGCRFCAAGFVYRPPRLWKSDAVLKALKQRPAHIDRVGLLGMEMTSTEDLQIISRYLLKEECSLSFSSLRADRISPELIEVLKKSGLKSAAIAPDGGSQRLRQVINKGLDEDDLLSAAELLAGAGIQNLKLYFMIGLPTEEQEDLEELVLLVHKIKKEILKVGRSRGKLLSLILSVNCFVPKAWTPFQYHPFEEVASLKTKLKFLKKSFAGEANISLKADQPGHALLQAMLARGDRRIGQGLLSYGGKGNWKQIFKQEGLMPEMYATRIRGKDEIFPWDLLDHGISREYLWKEYQRALAGKSTKSCDTEKCRKCGVCIDN
ncbi:MAG: radical SAM protein [Proteobacteria bacterium]|nr:radical SAM protein [Pseudomonadota bacterium]MBU1710828.1 radical SAM protein [Pseudomonadota bacterium]